MSLSFLFFFFEFKGKRPENFNGSNATKNRTEFLNSTDHSSSKNSEESLHENKANNPEIKLIFIAAVTDIEN